MFVVWARNERIATKFLRLAIKGTENRTGQRTSNFSVAPKGKGGSRNLCCKGLDKRHKPNSPLLPFYAYALVVVVMWVVALKKQQTKMQIKTNPTASHTSSRKHELWTVVREAILSSTPTNLHDEHAKSGRWSQEAAKWLFNAQQEQKQWHQQDSPRSRCNSDNKNLSTTKINSSSGKDSFQGHSYLEF